MHSSDDGTETSPSPSSDPDKGAADKAWYRPKALENGVRWLTEMLLTKGRVDRQEYEKLLQDQPSGQSGSSGSKKRPASDWSVHSRAVATVLETAGWIVTRDFESIIVEGGGFGLFRNAQFDPRSELKNKRTIGQLIALYIACHKATTVAIGSGTSAFHCGLALASLPPLEGIQVSTVNVALAAFWATLSSSSASLRPPVADVLIPKGRLNLASFRFGEKVEYQNVALTVIGADGCKLHRPQVPELWGKYSSTSENTNELMNQTSCAIVCALQSSKLEHKDRTDSGGALKVPKKGIPIYLVTDQRPKDNPIIEDLEKDGWRVVTDLSHWDTFEKESGWMRSTISEYLGKLTPGHPALEWEVVKNYKKNGLADSRS
jgi:hypothetical protein